MSRNGVRVPRVTVCAHLSEAEYERVMGAVRAEGESLSGFIRAALRAWVTRSQADQATAERESA
jgi:hypothetical protein